MLLVDIHTTYILCTHERTKCDRIKEEVCFCSGKLRAEGGALRGNRCTAKERFKIITMFVRTQYPQPSKHQLEETKLYSDKMYKTSNNFWKAFDSFQTVLHLTTSRVSC